MSGTLTHSARRRIAASPEVLFAALIEPDALETWLAPEGARLKVEVLDARPGGAFRFVLTFDSHKGRSGASTDVISGRYLALEPGHRVLSEGDVVSDDPASAGPMRTGWHFHPVDGGTKVEIIAENVPPGLSAEAQEAGFSVSLANLARYAELP